MISFYLKRAKPLRRAAFLEGVSTVLATSPGNFAWGFVVGLSMVNLGLSTLQSLGFAFIVYSGSAQMIALPLMAQKTAIGLICLAAFLGCIRFIIYSASMAPSINHLPMAKRLFVAAYSVDGAIGLFMAKRTKALQGEARFPHRVAYLMGMNSMIWLAWTCGMVTGILAAGALPPSAKFTYLGIVALVGIVIVMIQHRAGWACVVVSGVVSLLTLHWPYQLGLLASIAVGIATGFATEAASASKNRLQESSR